MEPGIDLRSDTMTRPSGAMRDAMREAKVGNDALGEDPTVNRLQEEAADILGKEGALFFPSGTMANLAALLVWSRRVERPEVIAESTAHLLLYESSSIARVAGAQARPIDGDQGRMPLDRIDRNLRTSGIPIKPQTALVCLEETHNHAGGIVLGEEYRREVARLASEHGVPLHVDGARLFNAAVAEGVAPSRIAAAGDSVMIALTKGLGAPMGSLLAGEAEFLEEAERARALLGGGLRQAGVVAAAGRIALKEGPPRLKDDHENAKQLAEGLASIEGLRVEVEAVESNIVFVDITALGASAGEIARRLGEEGVGVDGMMRSTHVRCVTHQDVTREDIDEALSAFERVSAKAL